MLRAAALVLLAACVVAGCGGTRANKAGGGGQSSQRTLTLLTGDDQFASAYAAAVQTLSHGRLRIEITVAGNRPSYEATTVESVRAGKADLGAVGARVWDAFGVTSLRALVAPLLVDSLPLERRVLESPLTASMLAGIDRSGVVGLAVLPGPLRRPLGLARPLVVPSDYRGATVAIRYGGVARATLTTLGASARGYVVGHLPAVDGAELDVNTIAENGFDAKARALTANVVLWPRPDTIFANRSAFERLPRADRDLLRRAGGAALEPALAQVERNEETGVAALCDRGAVTLVTASASQLGALRAGVQPVYGRLARDPFTRRALARIRALKAEAPSAPTAVARCPRATPRTGQARLAGTWAVTASYRELAEAGVAPGEAERQRGGGTLELSRGRWEGHEPVSGFVWRGRYLVEGTVLELITTACPRAEQLCATQSAARFIWSVYEDRLSLALLTGTPSYWGLVAKPLSRTR